jgi:hypothetical protein
MFEKHKSIDRITTEYGNEKVELADALSALEKTEVEKKRIIGEQRLLECEERAAQLMAIRKNVAAKTIQRGWRSYKARMMLKKKKRKKK